MRTVLLIVCSLLLAVIYRRGPGAASKRSSFPILDWVYWFNNRRLFKPIGNLSPAEAEAAYYPQLEMTRIAA
jgi:transposase InsO family protein